MVRCLTFITSLGSVNYLNVSLYLRS